MPIYTSSDIEKYLNGDLSAPQMHALEKAALEDPFLADAIEGAAFLHQSPGASFHKDIEDLQQRLNDRTTKKAAPVVRFNYRAAAALILLVGLGLTAYFIIFNKTSKLEPATIAKADVTKQTPAPILPKDTAPSPAAAAPVISSQKLPSQPAQYWATQSQTAQSPQSPQSPQTSQSSQTSQTSHSPQSSQTAQSPIAKSPAAATPPALAAAEDEKAKPALSRQLESRSRGIVVTLDSIRSADAYASADKQPFGKKDLAKNVEVNPARYDNFKSLKDTLVMTDQLVYTGRVTDFNNNALPGASLYVPGREKIVAVTDRNGNFALHLKKADSVNRVAVASVGYEPGIVTLDTDNRNANFIQLKPQEASLNEVVVSGYGGKRKEVLRRNINATEKPVSLIAVPADGWPVYNNYIGSSKKIFKLDSTLAGIETISFIVHQTGKLSSFKVVQSISPAHDSAVIRLIRQGPAWKLMKGRNERAVLSISFP